MNPQVANSVQIYLLFHGSYSLFSIIKILLLVRLYTKWQILWDTKQKNNKIYLKNPKR